MSEAAAYALIYTLRPRGKCHDKDVVGTGYSLWLPSDLAEAVGARRGATLTEAQFANPEVQKLLAARRAAQGGSR